MNDIVNNLEQIGFDKWVQESIPDESLQDFEIARVIAVHKDSFLVSNGEVEVLAELIGKLIFRASSPLDYPTVGDWILVTFFDEDTFAIIHEVIPRKSLLKRKTPGKKIDFQLIAGRIFHAAESAFDDGGIDRRNRQRTAGGQGRPVRCAVVGDGSRHQSARGIPQLDGPGVDGRRFGRSA